MFIAQVNYEKRADLNLILETVRCDTTKIAERDISFAIRALQKSRMDPNAMKMNYGDLRFILPTLSVYKGVFSVLGCAESNTRQNALHGNIDYQLHLQANEALHGITETIKLSMKKAHPEQNGTIFFCTANLLLSYIFFLLLYIQSSYLDKVYVYSFIYQTKIYVFVSFLVFHVVFYFNN